MNQTERDLRHPVWDIYDEYRTARLNVKINKYKLGNAKIINFVFEFVLALSASSSVASFWFWKNATGELLWQYLLVFTAIIAILKPLVNPSAKIQQFSEILTDFINLDHDFNKLTILINQQKKYNNEFQGQFYYLLDQKRFIDRKNGDSSINKKRNTNLNKKLFRNFQLNLFTYQEKSNVR